MVHGTVGAASVALALGLGCAGAASLRACALSTVLPAEAWEAEAEAWEAETGWALAAEGAAAEGAAAEGGAG